MTIGYSPFLNCNTLTDIKVDTNNTYYSDINGVLFNKNQTTLIIYPEGKNETSYIIPNGVIDLGQEAFHNNQYLTSITIPASTTFETYSGELASFNIIGAFMGVDLQNITVDENNPVYKSKDDVLFLKDMSVLLLYPAGKIEDTYTVPNGVTDIYWSGLTSSRYMKNLYIPETVTSNIIRRAYIGADLPHTLQGIYVDDNNPVYSDIDGVLFSMDKTELIAYPTSKDTDIYEIPQGTEKIWGYAMKFRQNITIHIPNSVSELKVNSISLYNSTSNIYFHGNVPQNWDTNAIIPDYYSQLTIYYPEGNTSGWASPTWTKGGVTYNTATFVPDGTGSPEFSYRKNSDGKTVTITGYTGAGGDVIIPYDIYGYPVTQIALYAFQFCSSITSITIHEDISFIGHSAFFGCNNLKNIYVNENNSRYADFDGVLIDYQSPFSLSNEKNVALHTYPIGKNAETYTIPNGVEHIGHNAFYSSENLKEIILSDSVTILGADVFLSCKNLEKVIIPASVEEIGYLAVEVSSVFNGCEKLVTAGPIGSGCNIEFGWETGIPRDAFAYATALNNVILPETITDIEEFAFWKTALTSISIPESVTTINSYAFRDCVNLTAAYFYGDVPSTWGSYIFADTHPDFTIYYPEGNTSGWESPTWTKDGVTYNTATFSPEEEEDDVEIKPTVSGIQESYTLTLGESLTLSGSIIAGGDGKLTAVNLKHNDKGTTFEPRRFELTGENTFDLSKFGELSTDSYPLNTVGTYEFVIYAAADNFTTTSNEVAIFTVSVTYNLCVHPNKVPTGKVNTKLTCLHELTSDYNHSYTLQHDTEYYCNACKHYFYNSKYENVYGKAHNYSIYYELETNNKAGYFGICDTCGYILIEMGDYNNRTPKKAYWNEANDEKEYVSEFLTDDGTPLISSSNLQYVEKSDEIYIYGEKLNCYLIGYTVTVGVNKGKTKYRFIEKNKLFETEEEFSETVDISDVLHSKALRLYNKGLKPIAFAGKINHMYSFEAFAEEINTFNGESLRFRVSSTINSIVDNPLNLIEDRFKPQEKTLLKAAIKQQLLEKIGNSTNFENVLLENYKSVENTFSFIEASYSLMKTTEELTDKQSLNIILNILKQIDFRTVSKSKSADYMCNVFRTTSYNNYTLYDFFTIDEYSVKTIRNMLCNLKNTNKAQQMSAFSNMKKFVRIDRNVSGKISTIFYFAGIVDSLVTYGESVIQIIALDTVFDSYKDDLLNLSGYAPNGLFKECVDETINEIKKDIFTQILNETNSFFSEEALDRSWGLILMTITNPWFVFTTASYSIITMFSNTSATNEKELTITTLSDELKLTKEELISTYEQFFETPSNELYGKIVGLCSVYEYQVEMGAMLLYQMFYDDSHSFTKELIYFWGTKADMDTAFEMHRDDMVYLEDNVVQLINY